jgi:hypothetical protein
LLILGSIIVFVLIQRPESIINQKSSLETINRERAKLVLELFKETNPQKIYLGLQVIKSTYPQEDSKWLDDIIRTYQEQSKTKTISDLNSKLSELIQDRDATAKQLVLEADGTGGSHLRGVGPIWREVRNRLEAIDFEIRQTQQQLIQLGVINASDSSKSN